MPKVFDLECYLPPDEKGVRRRFPEKREGAGTHGPDRLPELPNYGFANYERIFTRRGAEGGGTVGDAAKPQTLADFVSVLGKAGIERAVLLDCPNRVMAEAVQAFPDRFVALATLSPYDGMRAVKELERLVREEKFDGLFVGSLRSEIPASDRRYYPLYTKCAELGAAVRIYCSMGYANDRLYDLGHPRHIDQVATDFPELRIIAGLGGWPWVNEMVGLLRRHPNLYCDTSSHRPRHFATQGSGWEMLLQFGNTLLQDKIMVGLSAQGLGMSFAEIIAEYQTLPLKEKVIDKWLFQNAERFFRRG
jgi:predicted TIM-barrel fold metal-dependent hydrolase